MTEKHKRNSSEPEPISHELDTLTVSLIDYSLDLLSETGALPPTLAAEDARGSRTLLSFDDEDFEECIEEIRTQLVSAAKGKRTIEGLEGRPVRYAIAYDGVIDENGDGYEPALVVEYGEEGLSSGYSLYVFYRNAGEPQEFMWTDPAAAGEGELLV